MSEKARRYRECDRGIARLHRICLYRLLDGEKIHLGQPPILKLLLEKDGRNQCELACQIGVSRASVGVSLRRMEKAGLIIRQPDEKDTRYNLVYLTEEGRELAIKSEATIDLLTECRLRGFSEEEKETLLGYMERIQQNLAQTKAEICQKGEKNL